MGADIAIDIPATDAAGSGIRAWKKRLPLIIGTAVVVIATAFGVRKYIWSLHHESTDNAQLDGHITVIAPRVQAFVSRVLVDDNQHVKAGDTLVVLDDRDLKVRLQQAEADFLNARAAAGNDKRGGQARSQLLSSQAQQASAQAAIASAEATYK
jgi:membrane fusion protein (multidrug efflux system)